MTRRGSIAGTIKAARPHKVLGYASVSLSIGGNNKRLYIHRLVALAFIPNPEGKEVVNHRNGIRHDNRVENLDWVTYKENTIHSVDSLSTNSRRQRGSASHKAKLTENIVLEIRKRVAAGERQMDLAAEFGMNASTISSIVARRYWKHI